MLPHQWPRWFTDDWLRYDALDDVFVAIDLRMGMAGHYNFRFRRRLSAALTAAGGWHAVPLAGRGAR